MADLLRITLSGIAPGGEVWSINPVWSVEPLGGSVDYDDCLAIATAIGGLTIPTGFRSTYNSNTSLNRVKVEARTLSGALEAVAEYTIPSPVFGGGGGNHPPQTSVVSSLRTANPGPRGRGRLYLPGNGVGLDSTSLRITAANVSTIIAGVKTYLSGIEGAVQATVPLSTLCVWSRSDATLYQVNKILIGDVADVQRRRRDALSENYSSVSFP